ncbi:MAG: ester cyclase [Candidatus Heimdallarchaeota archaeon]|nr:ester cyclase [Candidatus Heimdallarchaeota archaeon]
MGNSNNVELVNLYFEDVMKNGKHELLDNIIHPAYIPFDNIAEPKAVDRDLMKEELMKITGIEGLKSRMQLFSEQFGDVNFQMMDVVETKETVVVHYKAIFTHIGTWNEIPASGTEISTYGFHLFKFKDDKIFSISGMLNVMDILSQLGKAIVDEKENLPEYLDSIRKLLKL